MEGEEKKSGWKIWVYLTPVYILIAIPLVKWTMKINSSDVPLSSEEVNVFNATEGEVKKRQAQKSYDPGLTDSGYSVRYRSGDEPETSLVRGGDEPQDKAGGGSTGASRQQYGGQQQSRQPAQGEQGSSRFQANANQAALESNGTRAKEAMGMGYQKGYLSAAVAKVAGSPKAVGALLNNKYVVEGFMSRPTVKAATGSAQGLANYLKGNGPSNFVNNPIVKDALNNPALVSAVAGSGLVAAMLNTPAAQELMKDPQALGDIVNNNPQLMTLFMQNPMAAQALMSNPDVAGLVGKFDTSKIKKY